MARVITETEVERRLAEGESLRSIARSFGITHQSLQSRRRRWGLPLLRPSRIPRSLSRWTDTYGYVKVRNPDGRPGGLWESEHVLIAEEMIGRPLNKDEVVHHVDGNKQNNKKRNLYVCTRAEHLRLHAELQRMADELVRSGEIVFDRKKKEYRWRRR